jgi:hypothetical protein
VFYPIPGAELRRRHRGGGESPLCLGRPARHSGPGPDTPLATGNQSDSLHALVNGRVIELRGPYPMGFFAKQIDGRIDDPDAGWKGRGLWVTSGNRTPVHIEGLNSPTPGAPGTTLATQSCPLVVHF